MTATMPHIVEAYSRLLALANANPQGLLGYQVEAWAIREGIHLATLAALVKAAVSTGAARIDGQKLYPIQGA